MTIKITLDEDDVRNVVAEKYGAKKDNVTIRIVTKTVGYGMGEHDKNCVEVEIIK